MPNIILKKTPKT